MRAAIVGAGSLGTIIGAFISKAGRDIHLIDSNAEHVRALNEHGATVTGSVNFTSPVCAFTPDALSGAYDLVFLLTKQTSTQETLSLLQAHLHADTTVCTLQNGIPELLVEKIVGKSRTVGGAVGFGATWLRPGVSSLTSSKEALENSAFEIGEMDGVERPRLALIKEYLECVGSTKILSNLMGIRFSKLLMNATFSGMSAALGCTFGEVLRDPRAMTCLAFIADECIRVAHAQAIRLVPMQGEDFERFKLGSALDIPGKMPLYRKIWSQHVALKASMLQDLEKGRATEIDYINGVVCRQGREHGVSTPFNDKVVEIVSAAQRRQALTSFDNLREFNGLLERHAGALPDGAAWSA
jgi:2-dehydropantoate 2-reductase